MAYRRELVDVENKVYSREIVEYGTDRVFLIVGPTEKSVNDVINEYVEGVALVYFPRIVFYAQKQPQGNWCGKWSMARKC